MTSNTSPNITPDPTPTRSHDLFQDPALAKSLEEDPVARFIVSHWKNIVFGILALITFFYLKTQISSTTDVRVSESSQTFDRARNVIASLEQAKQKAKSEKKEEANKDAAKTDEKAEVVENEKLVRSAKDSLVALKSGPEPYSLIAPLYENALNKIEGSLPSTVGSTDWASTTDSGKRLVLELQDFTQARAMLDSEQTAKEAISRLKKLAKESNYLRPPAVLVLLRVVTSSEDKSAAVLIAQEVSGRYPEQASKIEDELKRLM